MATYMEYKSVNQYKGILYGRRSLSVVSPEGVKVFHTGFRTINTYDELVKFVDDYPETIEILRRALEK